MCLISRPRLWVSRLATFLRAGFSRGSLRLRGLLTLSAALLFFLGPFAWAGLVDFSTGLLAWVDRRFGETALSRLTTWQNLIRQGGVLLARERLPSGDLQLSSRTEEELLRRVNLFFNEVPYRTDQEGWGVPDYWATPVEMLGVNAADCEDYAIAKYLTLKEIGLPIDRMRITYVRALELGVTHMVLAYYPTPFADPLILDNLTQSIRKASSRSDLKPVFSFNDDDLWTSPTGPGRKGGGSQVRLWRGLLDKLEREKMM